MGEDNWFKVKFTIKILNLDLIYIRDYYIQKGVNMAKKRYVLEIMFDTESGECLELIEYIDILGEPTDGNRVSLDKELGIILDTNELASA